MAMLDIQNITISYKNHPTVVDFSMSLEKGQIISIVGESGSGKTTVIRAALAFWRRRKGDKGRYPF